MSHRENLTGVSLAEAFFGTKATQSDFQQRFYSLVESVMNILIFGGAGFIGSHLCFALVRLGHRVRVFDHHGVSTKNLADILPRIELIKGDFMKEPEEISDVLSGIDIVVHLISTTLPKTSNDDPVHDVESNVIGTLKLLDLSRQRGVKKIVFLSSGGTVYGDTVTCPISETHATDPVCSYGITKLAIEKYLRLFHHLHDLDYVVLRVANPFGERQNPSSGQGAVAAFLWKILQKESITIWGDGSVSRDYFYVGDLVSAIVAAIEREAPSKIYNIGSGVPRTLHELLNIIQAVTGRTPIIQYTPARKLDVPINFLDISRAQQELLWQPQVSIEEGIMRTWRSLLDRKMNQDAAL